MRREQLSDGQPLSFCRVHHAVGNELAQCFFIRLLKLTSATGAEMSAGRRDMVRTWRQRAIFRDDVTGDAARKMSPRCSDAITLGGDAQDCFVSTHRNDAIADLTACASCPAVKAGPAIRAAS